MSGGLACGWPPTTGGVGVDSTGVDSTVDSTGVSALSLKHLPVESRVALVSDASVREVAAGAGVER